MTGSNHPRFRILIGWCCLMSAALLIMTVFLVLRNNSEFKTNTTHTDSKKETATPRNDKQSGLPPGQSFRSYIRLIRDQQSWICSPPCMNSSLSLKDKNITVAVSGYYFINAQVNFIKHTNISKSNQGTVTLLQNEGNGKSQRTLSEATRYEFGSVSINRIVYLMKNDSISLIIHQRSMIMSPEAWDTYWEIISL